MESLTSRDQLLLALGAAIGSNCSPCVESILPKARAAGLEDWELRLAIRTADFVRQKPAAAVLATAKAQINGQETSGEEPCPLDPVATPTSSGGSTPPGRRTGCCG